MRINVIACGASASKWDGQGDSIGVNDAYKWGHSLQNLVLLNQPTEFEPERLKIITNTPNPKTIYTCYREWMRPEYGLTNVVYFNYHVWQGRLLAKGRQMFQTAHTSPFAAISIAYNMGYDEIVLWGVDFKDHPIWNQTHHGFASEIKAYQDIAKQLSLQGVKVYSSEPSILKLPTYQYFPTQEEIYKFDKEYFND